LRNSILIWYFANSNIQILHGHLKILKTPSWTNKISNANRHNRQLSIGSMHNIHWRWNRKWNYVSRRHIKAKPLDGNLVHFSALWDSWLFLVFLCNLKGRWYERLTHERTFFRWFREVRVCPLVEWPRIGVSRMQVWRTLHEEDLYPYHDHKVQHLEPGDHAQRMDFCH